MNRTTPKTDNANAPAPGIGGHPENTQVEAAGVPGITGAAIRGGEAATGDARRCGLPGPPMVIRGANKVETEVGIDWFRCTGRSLAGFARLLRRMTEAFGEPELKRGLHFYDQRYEFTNKAQLLFDHQREGCKGVCIDLPGGALADLGSMKKVRDFCLDLLEGRSCVRLDLRVDFRTNDPGGVGLIDSVKASCERGELCHCRVWEPKEVYGAANTLLGYGVNLGRRGKDGSGRYVRVYDKGLEQKTLPLGQWERWEVEFTGDVAAQAALHLLGYENTLTAEQVAKYAFGAVDFHEIVPGETALAERPLAAWWRQLIDGINPVLVIGKRAPRSLERLVIYLRRCIAPTISTLARTTGETFGDVFMTLVGSDVEPPWAGRPILEAEYVRLCAAGQGTSRILGDLA